MNETEELLFGFFIFTVAVCVTVIPIIRILRPAKKGSTQPPKPEKQTFSVTVVDMRCGVKMVGFKTPKAIKEFVVAFESEEFGTFTLPVPEANYLGFEVGQTGRLTLVNGQLYSFVLED